MDPERYQRINALADAALEVPEEKRLAFLEAACEGNAELLREVEQLLAAQAGNNLLMQAPLLEQLAQDLAAGPNRVDLTGKQIHSYRVLSRIGAGGFGEVWLAEDIRLGRRAALKLLLPARAADPEQIRRFEREARAASSLNHPNIVTIYEIESSDGFDFMAQEFVEGETLRQRLAHGAMPFPAVLDTAAQVTSALAAAHRAGIIHRDIKPENIMLRPDGLLKVLDFGLARSVERSRGACAAEKSSLSSMLYKLVVGTARYMSPEQARGLPVDERSDVFSVGVVLYEIACGVPPFSGQTPSEITAAILNQEPPPICRRMPGIPPAFEAIVKKCLEKDPAKRYADAEILRLDLEPLLRERASARQKRKLWQWGAAAAVLIVALAVFGLWIYHGRATGVPSFPSITMTRLVTQGTVADAAISHDGDSVAYFLNESGGQSLWIRKLSSSVDTRILPPERGIHTGLAFSSSGGYLTWLRRNTSGASALYRMPVRGGTPVRLRGDLNSAVAFSPGGRRYAYFRIDPTRRESILMMASIDGRVNRAIATRRLPRYFSRYGLAWSPDGRWIACFAGDATSYTAHAFHLEEVRIADGAQRRMGRQDWLWAGSMAWPAPGVVLAAATTRLDDAYQVWSISTQNGRAAKVTNDLSDYSRLSASAGAKTILAIQTQSPVEFWVLPHGAMGQAIQIAAGVHDFNSLAWMPDGRIVYSALAGDDRNIWMMDGSGGNVRQLTTGAGDKREVAVTPNGKYILYHTKGVIWRMNPDGSDPIQLTHGPDDVHPDPSRDGSSVLYASFRDWSPGIAGKPTLWRVSIDGGEPVPVSDIAASVPRFSPDGNQIACAYFPGLDPQLSPSDVAILSFRGGAPFKVFGQFPPADSFASWAPNGRAIEFSQFDNIWRMPLSGGAPHRITAFTAGTIEGYAWSPDGAKLAVARATITRDIVLIKPSTG